jgi:P-type Cu+ transporter
MPVTKQSTTCYHCGEQCQEEHLVFEQHDFCCHGCRTVYSLLQNTGLTSYYEIEHSPGSTVKPKTDNKDFLDLDEVKSKFIEFAEGSQNRVTLYLPSMHCAACIWLLEKLQQLNDGVIKSEVNFLKKEITVLFDTNKMSLKDLVLLLDELGYPADLQRDKSAKSAQKIRKTEILKLGVAGFAFGNIMLFSFPEYLSLDDASLDSFKPIFNILNFGLALPVLFYSSTEYFKSAWKSLRVQFLTIDVPIALGIATLFLRSAYEIITQTGAGYFDSFAGLVFFLLIGKWYQNKTYDALAFDRDFKSYFPIAVAKITPAGEVVCMLEDIKLGDHLRILQNQVIPADAKLVSKSARIDYSFVSGESDILSKAASEILYAGGRNTGIAFEIEVVKEVSQSYLTSLWNQAENSNGKPPFSSLIDKVSKYFSIGILAIAFVTLAFWLWFDATEAVNAFTAVLIIACPCALALSMPFTAGNVSRILGKMGFFVKNADVLESLAAIDTIVFDKTGTLTKGTKFEVRYFGNILLKHQLAWIKTIANESSHPLSQALKSIIVGNTRLVKDLKTVEGEGISGVVDGALIKIGSAKFVGTQNINISESGSPVFVAINSIDYGHFIIKKVTRDGVTNMLSSVISQFKTYLLSGDNSSEKQEMERIFGSKTNLHFNQSPTNKRDFVLQLNEEGKKVMMLGDGLNDAGAIKAASVGIAVADNVFSFSPACDVILQADQLKYLDQFIAYTKKSMNVVKASVILSLLYNVIGLYFAVRGELTPIFAAILMPLSSISVVSFVTLLTNVLKPKTEAQR